MLSILVLAITPPYLFHHKVFFIFQPSKNQGEKTKQLRQFVNIHACRKLLIHDFIIHFACVERFEDINDFKNEYCTCFGINPLSFELIPSIVIKKLFFALKFCPYLVKNSVTGKKIINTKFKLEKFFTLSMNVMALIKDYHRIP
jgi:hypothetical protein